MSSISEKGKSLPVDTGGLGCQVVGTGLGLEAIQVEAAEGAVVKERGYMEEMWWEAHILRN